VVYAHAENDMIHALPTIHVGDCLEWLRTLPTNSVDAIVTDPPYGLGREPDPREVLQAWLSGEEYKPGGSGFMGRTWDAFVPSPPVWAECLRVLKPGGHLLAFAGTRTYDWIVMGVRLAGFEVRDMVGWIYGSGFPKSLDVSKAIDVHGGERVSWFGPWLRKWREENGVTQKEIASLFPSKTGGLTGCVANWELGLNMPTPEQFNAICKKYSLPFSSIEQAEREILSTQSARRLEVAPGQNKDRSPVNLNITAPATEAARQWSGYGTALKPAIEPVVMARKPLDGTVAQNVLKWGTGGINVDGCRVGTDENTARLNNGTTLGAMNDDGWKPKVMTTGGAPAGRWPANIIHDGSEEVLGVFPVTVSGTPSGARNAPSSFNGGNGSQLTGYADSGSAARFFYQAKASRTEREHGLSGLPRGIVDTTRAEDSAGRDNPRAGAGRSGEGRANIHPTVKPVDLMRYLIRLVTPPGGLVVDPYAGSGTTGVAAVHEGMQFAGAELDTAHALIAVTRIEQAATDVAEAQAAQSAQLDLFSLL
jgi:DNA modification methylase